MVYAAQVLLSVALALVAYILTSSYQSYRSALAFQAFARANNCQPPVLSRGRLPWGLDRIYKILTYKGGDFLEDFIFARFRSRGRWTVISPSFGNTFTVLTAEPRNIHAILSTKFADFGVGKRRYQQFGPLLGYGIFTADGPVWEHSRAILRPQFSRDQVNDLQAAEKHIQTLFQALPVTSDDGWTARTDLEPLFLRFMLDLATEWLFGKSVDSQLAALANLETPEAKASLEFGHLERSFDSAFRTAQETIAWRVRMQGLYWLMDSRKFRTACRLLHAWADHFVHEALRAKKAASLIIDNNANRQDDASTVPASVNGIASPDPKPKYSVLASMLSQTSDPLLLRSQTLSLLLAGRDTTARLLSFAFLELARHPPIWAALRTDVLATFGPDPSSSHPTTTTSSANYPPVTPQTLKSLPRLSHILAETLRLYPLVPLNNRTALRSTLLPLGGGPLGLDPLALPAGTVVTFAAYVVHRRPDIWGPDAAVWNPRRWEVLPSSESGSVDAHAKIAAETKIPPAGAFVPFNSGPRICIGMGWSTAVAGCVLVRMAQRFERIEADAGAMGGEVRKLTTLILAPKGGVGVRLRQG